MLENEFYDLYPPTDGLNYCNSKIDEANRKIQLAKVEQYSEEAKKYLDEGIAMKRMAS